MKFLPVFCTCTAIILIFSGCTPKTTAQRLVSEEKEATITPGTDNERVYMDELQGTLTNFTGNQITVFRDPDSYTFDISQATVECTSGIMWGENISVIYEGQLTDTDTSTVRALKVVDDYHQDKEIKETLLKGKLKSLTNNALILQTKDNKTVTCPITGTEQYFQSGIKAGRKVYIHYKGELKPSADDPNSLYGTYAKVLSVSDTEPLQVPDPTPTPTPNDEKNSKKQKQMRAIIQNLQTNTLTVTAENTDVTLNLNLQKIPCYFEGGAAVGSHVTITYTGDFNGNTTDGMKILGITGESTRNRRDRGISFTVSGEILASTANTLTLATYDGVYITCNIEKASNSSTGGLLTGSAVRITFNPADCRTTNIYTALKIEDA